MNNSLLTLGMNPEKSARNFNKLLRCPPAEAARQILEAVQKTSAVYSSAMMPKRLT